MEVTDLLITAARSLGSLVVLFILAKAIGNKQISQMNLFDYINGITIGSIAATMAIADGMDFLYPLVAMILYGGATVAINFFSSKSLAMRRILEGKILMLFKDGVLYRKNLAAARMDATEFLTQCRVNGYFNLADIYSAQLEPNGRLSILPRCGKRPVTPDDLSIKVAQEEPMLCVIIDEKILPNNLQDLGFDDNWLMTHLRTQNYFGTAGIFLAMADRNGVLSVYVSTQEAPKNDPYQ